MVPAKDDLEMIGEEILSKSADDYSGVCETLQLQLLRYKVEILKFKTL